MARIRSIKPGFFLNEQVSALPFQWRLLFVGLWTQADREGRLEDRPLRLKAMLFPYDDLDVNEGLGCLLNAGLITRYEGNGLRLVSIPTWAKHQQPHIKETQSEYPPQVTETKKHGARTSRAAQEQEQEQEQEGKRDHRAALRANFDQFWATYPRKVGKDAAFAVWSKLNPDNTLAATMLAAVQTQAQHWDDPKFIPHPKTWLHQGRWKDEANANGARVTQRGAAQMPQHAPWTCPHEDAHDSRWRCEQASALGRPVKAATGERSSVSRA